MKQHFRFAPSILSRLGEELIPNPEQGIVELVKNSYDADASECVVELHDVTSLGGSIIVSDDGIGMDLDDIANGWLVVGKSQKEEGRSRTQKFNRLTVGDKGLGRLAALRLGREVDLATVPEVNPHTKYNLKIKWDLLEEAEIIEDVPFDVIESKSDRSHGTQIHIKKLRKNLNTYAVQRLARELVLLADPFDNRFRFSPKLISEEFKEYEELVRQAYFSDSEFHLKAVLGEDGKAESWLYDWKKNLIAHSNHKGLSDDLYKSPAAEFDLWVFILDTRTFSTRRSTLGEVRNWLRTFGGVHLYHRGLRVRPYGDPGHDWLEMNLARARSPEERPSTNTSIGKVVVDDPGDELVQKTDRLGFIESDEFSSLRKFAIDSLNWMASRRLALAEERRDKKRRTAISSTASAKKDLENLIEDELSEYSKKKVAKKIIEFEKAVEKETISLREDLQLYRTLATAGTTSAVFAHETSKPVTLIAKTASRIEGIGKSELGEKYIDLLAIPVGMLRSVAESLKSFAKFPLHLLKREKRQTSIVPIKNVIRELLELFEPFLSDSGIEAMLEAPDEPVLIVASVSLVEAIITNLLTNAINAFNMKNARVEGRQILIRVSLTNDSVVLHVMDNGPGIQGISIEDIWLPGRTTTPGGTGFGLTIVKDSVSDLDGEISAIKNGEIGGAEIIIVLPRAKD